MGYLDMNPPEEKETAHTINAWMPYEMVVDNGEVIEIFINGKNFNDYTDIRDLKEQLLDSMKRK
jgi:hypothetical protein